MGGLSEERSKKDSSRWKKTGEKTGSNEKVTKVTKVVVQPRTTDQPYPYKRETRGRARLTLENHLRCNACWEADGRRHGGVLVWVAVDNEINVSSLAALVRPFDADVVPQDDHVSFPRTCSNNNNNNMSTYIELLK